jgi:hypothetical protein
MTKQLATIKEYGPPYWKERAWDLSDFEDWEWEMLAAVKVSGTQSVEDDVTHMETSKETREQWGKPYGKTRAFGYDFHADIMKSSSHQLREWRQERAARFVQFDPDTSDEIALWENWEGDFSKWMKQRYAQHDQEVAAPVLKWFAKWGVDHHGE